MVSSKAIAAVSVALFFLLNSVAFSSGEVTALFAFGDSTLDPGNNNYLLTIFRSDHAPYGETFPDRKPTGRFCDGRLSTDFMVSWLGLKPLLPAYLDKNLTDQDLMTGASFGSAGSGLDDLTARPSNVWTMDKELDQFDEAVERIKRCVGPAEAKRIVNNAVFIISAGTNDVVFNFYLLPFTQRRTEFKNSMPKYQDFLLNNLQNVIEALHSKGARKFAVAGLPPVGCLPIMTTIDGACAVQQNKDSVSYNNKLKDVITRLNSQLDGVKVTYGDIYTPLINMVRNPSEHKFDGTLHGCCGLGMLAAGPLCTKLTPTCPDPSRYIFWDSIHPTEAAYKYIAQHFEKTALSRLIG